MLMHFFSLSPGLQSVNNEQIDKRTFDIVKAGDQLSFKMSKQITPWLFILQWYILVLKSTCSEHDKVIKL